MKTEKLSTRKSVDDNILGFVNLVKNFTYNELYQILRTSDGSLVYTSDGKEYFVGRYVIARTQDTWTVLTHLGDVQHEFQSKSAAIFYSMALMKSRVNLADQLAKTDYAVLINKAQLEMHNQMLKTALKKKDAFKSELLAAKRSDSKYKYTMAKEELEKTLNMAKYLKLGT